MKINLGIPGIKNFLIPHLTWRIQNDEERSDMEGKRETLEGE